MRFVKKRCKELECLNAKMRSGKVCYRGKSSIQWRKGAFTLAEVLITLGIIGVVAAMTMPSLIQNYQEKATVTKLKKCYSLVSQAYVSILNDEGGSDTLQAGDDLEMMEKFGKYLKYQNRFAA